MHTLILYVLLFIALLLLLNGCVYRTRQFVIEDQQTAFGGWLVEPHVVAYEGSRTAGISKENNYHCYIILSLHPKFANDQPNKSNYEAKIDKVIISFNGKTYERINEEKQFVSNETISFELPQAQNGTVQKIFIPKDAKKILCTVECSFKEKSTQAIETKVFNYNLIKSETKTIFFPLD